MGLVGIEVDHHHRALVAGDVFGVVGGQHGLDHERQGIGVGDLGPQGLGRTVVGIRLGVSRGLGAFS